MRKISMLLILSAILYSCGSSIDTQALRDEVLDIHDEVMPKLGDVMSLRKKVMSKSQELTLVENHDQSEVASLDSLAEALELANKGMMTWMNDWNKNSSKFLDVNANPIQGVTIEDVAKYLNDEKQRVTKVKENMNAAIKSANEALKN